MVYIECSACGHGWDSKARGTAVRCGECGSRNEVRTVVKKRAADGKSWFGITRWGGFSEEEGGFLSNWGGIK